MGNRCNQSNCHNKVYVYILLFCLNQDLPEETNLSYLDRGILEAEYQKLMELKTKAEKHAHEASQKARHVCIFSFLCMAVSLTNKQPSAHPVCATRLLRGHYP